MHTNPPESISLNKSISCARLGLFSWVLVYSIAFASCKPNDPIMNAAEQFHEKGIITASYMDTLKNAKEQNGQIHRTEVLNAVFRSSHPYNVVAQPPYPISEFGLIEKDTAYTKYNQENFNFLYGTGFLSQSEYDYLLGFRDATDTVDIATALLLVAHIIEPKERKLPKYLKNFEHYLTEIGVADYSKVKEIESLIDDKTLTSQYEVLTKHKSFMPLKFGNLEYPASEKDLLKQHIYSINDYYQFGKIDSINVIAEPLNGSPENWFKMRLELALDGKLYLLNGYSSRGGDGFKFQDDNWYRVFNLVLAYQQRGEQLYRLDNIDRGFKLWPTDNKLGLILLKHEQEKGLRSTYKLNDGSWEISEEPNVQVRQQYYIEKMEGLKSTSLFNHIPDNQFSGIVNRQALNADLRIPYNFLDFPDVAYPIPFSIDENEDKPYEKILHQFANISHGKFNPEQIIDGYCTTERGAFYVEFTWQGKKYKQRVFKDELKVDESFIDFIVQSVLDENAGFEFLNLDDKDIYMAVTQNMYPSLAAFELLWKW